MMSTFRIIALSLLILTFKVNVSAQNYWTIEVDSVVSPTYHSNIRIIQPVGMSLINPVLANTIFYEPTVNLVSNILLNGILLTKKSNRFEINLAIAAGFYNLNNFYVQIPLGVLPSVSKVPFWLAEKNVFLTYFGNVNYKIYKYIDLQLGRGKIFLGDGYRSLFLGDNAPIYPYLRGIANVWKIKYVYQISMHSVFSEPLYFSDGSVDMQYYGFEKFNFMHYLSINIGKRLNINFFESVIQSNRDSLGLIRGPELAYVNPVIFFRSLEFNLGSKDNVIVGVGGHLRLFSKTLVYAQFVLDEFLLKYITDLKTESWTEKYGFQAGMKSYDFLGIKNFYTQLEFNAVRPFTYSHVNNYTSYTHHYHALAHPLGANFVEGLIILKYAIPKNIEFGAELLFAKIGLDDTLNYGRNPNLSYNTRFADLNVPWLCGKKVSFGVCDFEIAKKIKDTKFFLRFFYSQLSSVTTKYWFSVGVSKNFFETTWDWF